LSYLVALSPLSRLTGSPRFAQDQPFFEDSECTKHYLHRSRREVVGLRSGRQSGASHFCRDAV